MISDLALQPTHALSLFYKNCNDYNDIGLKARERSERWELVGDY